TAHRSEPTSSSWKSLRIDAVKHVLGSSADIEGRLGRISRMLATSHLRQSTLLYVCIGIALLRIAIGISAAGAGIQHVNETVYWECLRSMRAAYHLYGKIFYPKPPLFLLSIHPFYELLGSSITSARVSVASLSLLGLPGAYLMGKALSGRAGGIA